MIKIFVYGTLKPGEANQFDVSLEWYLASDSILSAGVFYKDVKNFVTSLTKEETIVGLPFTVERIVNGDTAEVKGIELAGQQFLANGFGARASFTYNDSSARLGDIKGDLEGVIPISYNLSLLYERGGVSSQVTYRFDGKSTDQLSGDVEGLAVKADSYQDLSFTLSYDLKRQVTVFVEGTNLLDESLRRFNSYRNVPAFYEQNGRSLLFGIRGRL